MIAIMIKKLALQNKRIRRLSCLGAFVWILAAASSPMCLAQTTTEPAASSNTAAEPAKPAEEEKSFEKTSTVGDKYAKPPATRFLPPTPPEVPKTERQLAEERKKREAARKQGDHFR
jgi:hypothetical protein